MRSDRAFPAGPQSTVTILLDTVGEVSRALGISFEFVNIGGGLGIPYRDGDPAVDVEDMAARLHAVFDARLAANGIAAPRLAMEHGRYLTGPSGWLVARCQALKQTSEWCVRRAEQAPVPTCGRAVMWA